MSTIDAARDHRVEHGRDDQEARNVDVDADQVEIERAADGPQHDDEGCRRQEGRGDAGDEIDGRFGRDPHIVGDAVFRVLVVAADQIELIIAAVLEPAIDQIVGQPLAPAPLQGHARIDLNDS